MSVEVRRAGAEEAPAIVRLVNAAFVVEAEIIEGDRTDLEDIRAKQERGVFLLAVDGDAGGGAPVGCVYVEVNGPRGYLGMLSVDPSRQRTGLGRVLTQAAEDLCRARGCQVMDIQIVNLRGELPPYYERLGYRPSGTAPFPAEATSKLKRPCHFVRMSKPLGGAQRA